LEVQKLVDDSVKGDVKADQGTLQKRTKRLLKLLLFIIKKKNSIGIYTGHQYGDPNSGMYSDGLQIGGGKFASLAPDIILQLKKSKKFGEEKSIIGTVIKAMSLKNRFYPPFNKCEVDIDYINGINKLHGMVDLASEFNLIEKGGAGWYTNKETNEKIQGSNKVES
jgi:recombination protein RecA